jgi:cyclophilin family peptidyl-prolyl cis-trans isomerase
MPWQLRVVFVAVVLCVLGLGGWAVAHLSRMPDETHRTEKPVSEIQANRVVVLETSMGTIRAELWPDKAPKTVQNWLQYVDEGHYDGTIFHRVMDGFMIQGGGFTADMREKPTRESIPNEARADVPNTQGTLAMARTPDPHSASAQFFINLVDNDFLDHRDRTRDGFGYCVFGKVIEGFDVVQEIGKARTASRGGHDDVPVEPIVIQSIRRAP